MGTVSKTTQQIYRVRDRKKGKNLYPKLQPVRPGPARAALLLEKKAAADLNLDSRTNC